jgi:hypothetical protein
MTSSTSCRSAHRQPAGDPNERAEASGLGEWSVTVADHLAEAAAFYQYLDRRPERRLPLPPFRPPRPDPRLEGRRSWWRAQDRIQAVARS